MSHALTEEWNSKSCPKSRNAKHDRLTERELEVISQLQRGLTNRQIANELSVTTITVKHHLSHIYCKLDVENRLQLAILASEHGLVGNADLTTLRHLQTQKDPIA